MSSCIIPAGYHPVLNLYDTQKAIGLIRRAIDGGVTYMDTAYVYLDRT